MTSRERKYHRRPKFLKNLYYATINDENGNPIDCWYLYMQELSKKEFIQDQVNCVMAGSPITVTIKKENHHNQ